MLILMFTVKNYLLKLERLDLRNIREENNRWLKQEYPNNRQVLYTENSIVRKRIDKKDTRKAKKNGCN
jgi:hypothetical protein